MATGFASRAPNTGSLYRAVWRWHFYAGLLVLPFLLWLAVTGSLYLYRAEIEQWVYGDWIEVTPAGELRPLHDLVATTVRQTGGTVTQVARPARPDESWRLTISVPSGNRRTAFVHAYTGEVLGTTRQGGVMQTVRDLHSLIITGPVGNMIIEIVAGWAILLVLSGFYLWWPRRGSPVVGVRGSPRSRRFWRDLHASTGAVAGAAILFLALTGMPWSAMWGKTVQSALGEQGLGRPQAPGPAPSAGGHVHREANAILPWSLQQSLPPVSHGPGDIGPDQVVAVAAAHGLQAPWTLTLPARPGDPYLLSKSVTRANEARVLYVDAASGDVLQDARYADFGAGARFIEWGIATHQGQEYGEPNRLLMLVACLSVILLAVTAPVLWWKRRGNGKLAPPPAPVSRRSARGVAVVMLAIGALFPLTGATILAALAIDRLWMMTKRVVTI